MNVPEHTCGQLTKARITVITKKTLYFAKTDLNHLDVVIPAEPTEAGNDSNNADVLPQQIETDLDDDGGHSIITFALRGGGGGGFIKMQTYANKGRGWCHINANGRI